MVKEKKLALVVGPTDVDGDRIWGSARVSTTGTLDSNGLRLPELRHGQAAHLVRRIMAECHLTLLDVAMEPSQLASENGQPAATLRAMNDYQRQPARPLCKYMDCFQPVADGSEWCQPHRDHMRRKP